MRGDFVILHSISPKRNFKNVENLTLHIEYLLLRHDCVVVPGVGAFINVRHSARFDATSRSWLPPTREVRFNGVLTHDDGLLTTSYARKHGVTFPEGRELLRRDVTGLTETLRTDGEATIGQLGILHASEGKIRFSPRLAPSDLAGNLGYATAPVPHKAATPDHPVATETVRIENGSEATAAVRRDSRRFESGDSKTESQVSESRKRKRFDTRRNYYIGINKMFARVTACCLIVIAMVATTLLPVSDCKREDQAAVVPVEQIIRTASERVAAASETVSETARTEQAAAPAPDNADSALFHAVVATFRTPVEAQTFVEANSGSGYRLHVVSSRTRSRVAAYSSDNRDELQRLIATPEFRARFSQAWIWEAE